MFLAVNHFNRFDEVTRYRLENAFIFALIIGLTMPVFSNLKGLLSVTVLSVIAILSKLIMKTNDWFDKKFTLSQIYKMGIILNIMFVISTCVYFYSPKIMIFLDSVLSVLEFGIYSVYSIKLNQYLTSEHPENFRDFQKVRNATWADGTLLGLGITSMVSMLTEVKTIIIAAITIYLFYIGRLIYNWNFFDNRKIGKRY